jgi:hypothetical protein
MNRCLIPYKVNAFLRLHSLQNYSEKNLTSYSIAFGAIIPRLKQPGREITTHLHPFMRLRIREIVQAGHAIELSTGTIFFLRRLLQENRIYAEPKESCVVM